MTRTRHIWSDAEDATLRRLYRVGRSDDEIAAALGVSTAAVLSRRNKLRLVREPHRGHEKPRSQRSAA